MENFAISHLLWLHVAPVAILEKEKGSYKSIYWMKKTLGTGCLIFAREGKGKSAMKDSYEHKTCSWGDGA